MRRTRTTIPNAIGQPGKRWALVLAAGEGRRLGHLTVDERGLPTPKQFCSVSGGPTLLQQTLQRAERLVGRDRVSAVVAAQHGHWWENDTSSLSRENVIVQPQNRGTATGILLPLLSIARRDSGATVVVLPSDHFIAREAEVEGTARRAFKEVERHPDAVVLLGITPDQPDPELGWIVPSRSRASNGNGGRPVERFVEKPPVPVARVLQERGGLWNSFIFVARVSTLLRLYAGTLPALLNALGAAVDADAWRADTGAVVDFYKRCDSRDFSRDLLEPNVNALRVLPVGECGWTDLGTPERLARCVAGLTPQLSRRPPKGETYQLMRPVLAAVV